MAVTVDPNILSSAHVAGLICAARGVLDALDAGSSNGYFQIRTGGKPAAVTDAATGTLLATLFFAEPAFADPVENAGDALATANAILSDNEADATGTAGWFRAYDSNGAGVLDGTAGDTGTEDLVLNESDIVAGQVVGVNSMTYRQALA